VAKTSHAQGSLNGEFHSYRQDLREEKENIIIDTVQYWWPFIGVSHAEKRVVNRVEQIKIKEEIGIHLDIWECVYMTIWGSENSSVVESTS